MMADPFAPPPATGRERAKPPLCGVRDGEAQCTLYRGHLADFHRDQHRQVSWPVDEAAFLNRLEYEINWGTPPEANQ
jgi:hypothetical protein